MAADHECSFCSTGKDIFNLSDDPRDRYKLVGVLLRKAFAFLKIIVGVFDVEVLPVGGTADGGGMQEAGSAPPLHGCCRRLRTAHAYRIN